MKRSFASLNAQEGLQMAIFIEKRNAEVYKNLEEMFRELGDEESLELATVFWEMSTEEKGHEALLREKYAERYMQPSSAQAEYTLVESIEMPEVDINAIAAARSMGLPSRNLALQVALRAEIDAQRYYAGLVPQTPEGPLRQLYRELAGMERQHAIYLATKLVDNIGELPELSIVPDL